MTGLSGPAGGTRRPHPRDPARDRRAERRAAVAGGIAAAAIAAIAAGNLLGLWTVPFGPGAERGSLAAIDGLALAAAAILLPYGAVRSRTLAGRERAEAELPALLDDLAESVRHGLSLAAAVERAGEGSYGPLSAEVRRMARELRWGIPVDEAIAGLADRLPTPLLRRTAAVVRRAEASGGSSPELLARLARDARAALLGRTRRREAMGTYLAVVVLAFGVFLLTVVVLAAVYLPALATSGGVPAGTGGLGLAGASSIAATLVLALTAAVLVHGVGDGLVAGLMVRGRLAEGMVYAGILVLAGWSVMRFVVAPVTGGA
ncbi:MAG: type II secretion system F family protein [Thermoplasmata archaeon]